MTHYRVVVLSLKQKRAFPLPADDEVFIQQGDSFFGYGYANHRIGKYFDLWFTDPKEKDPDNFVTFGRIVNIIPEGYGNCAIYITKFGRFLVEDMTCSKNTGTARASVRGIAAKSVYVGSESGRSLVAVRASSSREMRPESMYAASRLGLRPSQDGKKIPHLVQGAGIRTTTAGKR